ncbi:MAG TPA: O-antigen ligase family protein [Nitrospiraceae bacterium]|nr:O-antigen ligase family protein [Nitrospiraceae bacterium]
MNLTAILILGLYALGLAAALLRHPIFGLFSYLFIFYNPPAASWWGAEIPDLRWSLLAAVVTLIATIWRASSSTGPSWFANWGVRLLFAYTLWVWIQSIWAVDISKNLEGAILFTKYLVLAYLITHIVLNEEGFEFFSWVHVVGCFMWGWIAYTTPQGGRLESIGAGDVAGSNGAAMHLTTGLFFAGIMFLTLPGSKRWVVLLMIPFLLNAFVLALSRGGFLGLLSGGVVSFYLSPRTYRKHIYAAAALAVLLLLLLAHPLFWERVGTLQTSDVSTMDVSAKGRLDLINYQWKMFLDNPLGVGHRGNEVLSPRYMPQELLEGQGVLVAEEKRIAAHNTFMAVLVDQGLPGAIMFILLITWFTVSFVHLKSLDDKGLAPLLGMYRVALGCSFVSWFVAGQFSNFMKAEVWIWILALLVALTRVSHESIKNERVNTSESSVHERNRTVAVSQVSLS